jgi:hypothetical protein
MRALFAVSLSLVLACGGGFREQSLPAPANPSLSSLSALWVFADNDVWVSGARTLHFDGSSWSEKALPGGLGISDFWGLAPNDLWGVAGNKVFRWQGSAWSEVTLSETHVPELEALWVRAADDFAVGGGVVNAEVLRFVNGSWSRKFGGVTDLWGSAANDVWAVAGHDGFLHWTGSGWTAVSPASSMSGGNSPEGIFGLSASDVWAVGDGNTLQHWDGSAWTATETEDDLAAVWGSATDDVWVAGDDGAIVHFNGTSWSRQSVGNNVRLTKLHGSSKTSVWALGYRLSVDGNHGVVFRL